MTKFPAVDLIYATQAQAFADGDDPDHGYVRFEADGKVHQFRLPRRFFEQLARDIQAATKQIDLQALGPSPANNPNEFDKGI